MITAAQRIPALQNGDVDIVARNMTINCDRWKQIAFSTEYYRSGQKILVRKGSKATTLADLAGQRVCAPNGTSSMDNLIRLAPEGDRRSAPTATPAAWCCSSRARSTRSPATTPCWPAWPRRTRTRSCPSRRRSPPSRTGSASTPTTSTWSASSTACSAQMRADGEWTAIYNRWLAAPLGPAPAPPKAVYGTDAVTVGQRASTAPGAAHRPHPGRLGRPLDAGRGCCLPGRARRSGATRRRAELDELDAAALAGADAARP